MPSVKELIPFNQSQTKKKRWKNAPKQNSYTKLHKEKDMQEKKKNRHTHLKLNKALIGFFFVNEVVSFACL